MGPPLKLTHLALTNYLFKAGVEVLMTPVTYLLVNFLKRVEREDFYDRGNNFNPFKTWNQFRLTCRTVGLRCKTKAQSHGNFVLLEQAPVHLHHIRLNLVEMLLQVAHIVGIAQPARQEGEFLAAKDGHGYVL